MAAKVYRFVIRPSDAEHGHPILVYNCVGQLHYALTRFAFLATAPLNDKTIKVYLYAILPFFTWLDTDEQQKRSGRHWQEPPEQVRWTVEDYLVQQLRCQIQQHHLGFQLIRPTAKTPCCVRMFLVALKCFYKLMSRQGYYAYPNPLVDSLSQMLEKVSECLEEANQPPRLPDISGVQEPNLRQRLTDSYYKFAGEEWVPQIIDDASLPRQVLEGGRQLPGWGLREECVTRMLFETGGRVSEIVGLTLADWVERGLQQEANTFSKGSNGIRIKFIRFSNDTAKLLRRYFNKERQKYDPNGYTLDNYFQLAKHRQIDLHTVPLFLTAQRTSLSPATYRKNYWNPACFVAGINADVHQARHWYVTMAVRKIYEDSNTEGDVKRRLLELQEYMKWKSSETIEAYEHYFTAARHAEVQDSIHTRMDESLKQHLEKRQQTQPQQHVVRPAKPLKNTPTEPSFDSDFNYLRRIGGSSSGS